MIVSSILLAACMLAAQASDGQGTLGGIVVKTVDQSPVAGAEVVLREYVDGRFLAIAKTTSDADGKYYFRKLPADGQVYQPGANHGGVHYPGEKVRLSPRQPVAGIKLEVCDPLAEPCPLVVRRHDILIEPLPGKVRVREVLQIENPGTACYVGKPIGEGGEPVTLQVSIPANFERATFDKEYYGRRFSVRGGKMVTNVPWTPGQRELAFMYVLPNDSPSYVWERAVDLPSQEVRLTVRADDPDGISCNLGTRSTGESGEVVYLVENPLPAGQVLRVELGCLPISAMAYARWAALALLAGAVAFAAVMLRRKSGGALEHTSVPEPKHDRQRRQRAETASRKGRVH